MTDDQKAQALYALQPDAPSPINDLFAAMGTIGSSVVGALGFAFGSSNTSNSNTANNANAEPLVGRRREDEEGGEPEDQGTTRDRNGEGVWINVDRELTSNDLKKLIHDFEYGEGLDTQVASLDNLTPQNRYGLKDTDLQAK